MQCEVKIHLNSYIGSPFWPETNDIINISKHSRLAFQRTEEKRTQTLNAYLSKINMTKKAYNVLLKKSERQWYRLNNDNQKSKIIIPKNQMSASLVEACKVSPTAVIQSKLADCLRAMMIVSDFVTKKTKCDEIFKRYIRGESNQPRYTESEVINNFDAIGTIDFDVSVFNLKTVTELFNYQLKYTGLGASRKMGYGRSNLVHINELRDDVASSQAKSKIKI